MSLANTKNPRLCGICGDYFETKKKADLHRRKCDKRSMRAFKLSNGRVVTAYRVEAHSDIYWKCMCPRHGELGGRKSRLYHSFGGLVRHMKPCTQWDEVTAAEGKPTSGLESFIDNEAVRTISVYSCFSCNERYSRIRSIMSQSLR